MVASHELSANLVIALEKDLIAYQKRCRERVGVLASGSQLPRTRYGWLIKHYRFDVPINTEIVLKNVPTQSCRQFKISTVAVGNI